MAGAARTSDSSVLVLVDDPGSVRSILDWSLHQAARRNSRINVLYVPGLAHVNDKWISDPETVEVGRKEVDATLDRLNAGSRATFEVGELREHRLEAIRDWAMSNLYGLVMVGPLEKNTLVRLIFGSDRCGVDPGPGLTLAVVPRSAWSTALPSSTPSSLTVGFDGSAPAVAALAWAVREANRRGGVVRAVMAWCEGEYASLGGPVGIVGGRSSGVGGSARHLATDSLMRSGVPADRVVAIPRRGMPAATLMQEAVGSDLLCVSAGRSDVFGHRTLGATTTACLTRSPVPVVIVP
jgi:nucleotide-binding universal stress UspA family protein